MAAKRTHDKSRVSLGRESVPSKRSRSIQLDYDDNASDGLGTLEASQMPSEPLSPLSWRSLDRSRQSDMAASGEDEGRTRVRRRLSFGEDPEIESVGSVGSEEEETLHYTPLSDDACDTREAEEQILLMAEGRENLSASYTLKEGATTILCHACLASSLLGEINSCAMYLLSLDSHKDSCVDSHLIDVERAITKRRLSHLVERIGLILKQGVTDVVGARTRESDI